MHSYYKPPIDLLVKLFNLNGINPLKKSFVQNFILIFELASILTVICLVFFNLLYNKMSKKLFVDSVESLFTCSQLFVKLSCFAIKKSEIKELFLDISKFWNLNQFDPKFRQECIQQLKNVESITKTFIILCVFVMFFFMCCPFFLGRLAIICYVPEFVPKVLFTVYNSWVFGFNGMGVVAFDSFVCTVVFLLSLQYKLLNKKIQLLELGKVNSRVEEILCLKEMVAIIRYHNFLYSFLRRLNSVIGVTAFIQFILYIVSMGFEMYFFTKGSENLVEAVQSLMYITTLSFEMVICFCVPSTFITAEASKTVQVIYESKWYETSSTPIKKYILIMMVKSQQEAALWAGNMFVINLETCTEAFKKTLSFYACLKTIGEND